MSEQEEVGKQEKGRREKGREGGEGGGCGGEERNNCIYM